MKKQLHSAVCAIGFRLGIQRGLKSSILWGKLAHLLSRRLMEKTNK
jgi:hypothetical protein